MHITHWHPAADAFPFMQGDDFESFVEDIRLNGVLKPIEYYDGERWPEFKNFGIDGRNRQRACQKLGIDPPVRKLTDADVGDSLTSYIASVNVARRHLTTSQAAVVALEVEKHFGVENAAKRKLGAIKGGMVSAANRFGQGESNLPQRIGEGSTRENRGNSDSDGRTNVHSQESAQQAAAAVGTNRQYIYNARKIAQASEKLLGLIRDGRLTIRKSMSVLKQRQVQWEILSFLERGEINVRQFRGLCAVKKDCSDLWVAFRQGNTTADEAIKKMKQLKEAERSANQRIPRGEELGVTPEGHLLYLAKEGEPTDLLDRPLDPELIAVFAKLADFDALIASIGQCRKGCAELARHAAGSRLNPQILNDMLENAQDHLRKQAPYCVCPSCGGFGHQDTERQVCPTWAGKRFMSEASFARMNEALREIAGGYKGRSRTSPKGPNSARGKT